MLKHSKILHNKAEDKSSELRIFIAYRQEDGSACAEWWFNALQNKVIEVEDRDSLVLQPYWDKNAPAVGDWESVWKPGLKSAKAFILIVSNAVTERRKGRDCLYDEINWWIKKRKTAPILIDADKVGIEGIPMLLRNKWPNAQLIDWSHEPATAARALSRVIRGIEHSIVGVVYEDLVRLRRRLFVAIAGIVMSGALAITTTYFFLVASESRDEAIAQTAIAENQTQLAETNAKTAKENAIVATSRYLSGEAVRASSLPSAIDAPDRTALLALQGIRIQSENNSSALLDSTNALVQVLQNSHSIATLWHDSQGTSALDFNATGKYLAAGHDDNTVSLWDTDTWKEIIRLGEKKEPRRNNIEAIALNKDGDVLVWFSKGNIHIWNIQTSEKTTIKDVDEYTNQIVLSEDGQLLISGSSNGITFWDIATRQQIHFIDSDNVVNFSFDYQQSRLVYSTFASRISVVDIAQWKGTGTPNFEQWERVEIDESYYLDVTGNDNNHMSTMALCKAKNCQGLIAVGHRNGEVSLWQIPSGKKHSQYSGKGSAVTKITFNSTGDFMAVGFNNERPELWDLSGTEPIITTLEGHDSLSTTHTLAFHPKGDSVVTANAYPSNLWRSDKERIAIRSWGVKPGTLLSEIIHKKENIVRDVAINSDGKYIFSASEKGLDYIDLEQNTAESFDEGNFLSEESQNAFARALIAGIFNVAKVATFSNSKRIAWATESGRVFYETTKDGIKELEMDNSGEPQDLVLSRNSERLAISLFNPDMQYSQVIVFDREGNVIKSDHIQGLVSSIEFDPTGEWLVVGEEDAVVFWDLIKNDSHQLRYRYESVRDIVFSPNGTHLLVLATDYNGGILHVWEMTDKRLIDLASVRPQEVKIHAEKMVVSWDGKQLITKNGRILTAWNMKNWQRIVRLSGHKDRITSLKSLPSSEKIITSSEDGTIRSWFVSPESWIRHACRIAGRSLSRLEWQHYTNDVVEYKDVCANPQSILEKYDK